MTKKICGDKNCLFCESKNRMSRGSQCIIPRTSLHVQWSGIFNQAWAWVIACFSWPLYFNSSKKGINWWEHRGCYLPYYSMCLCPERTPWLKRSPVEHKDNLHSSQRRKSIATRWPQVRDRTSEIQEKGKTLTVSLTCWLFFSPELTFNKVDAKIKR